MLCMQGVKSDTNMLDVDAYGMGAVETSLIRSIRCRQNYGGMKSDTRMLGMFARVWAERFTETRCKGGSVPEAVPPPCQRARILETFLTSFQKRPSSFIDFLVHPLRISTSHRLPLIFTAFQAL